MFQLPSLVNTLHINTYDYTLNKYVATSLSLNFSTFIYDASVSTLYIDTVSLPLPRPLRPRPKYLNDNNHILR